MKQSCSLFAAIILYCCCLSPSAIAATDSVWKKLGPITGGGFVLNFSEAPNGTMYCSTPYAAFRSSDNGNQWLRISDALPKRIAINWINVTRNGSVFLATESGLYRSLDSGSTWLRVDKNQFGYPPCKFVNSDPRTGAVYVGIPSRLFCSTDNGESWSSFADSIPSLYRNPRFHGRIFFGKNNRMTVSLGQNAFWSTNNGLSWQMLYRGLKENCSWVAKFAENKEGTGIIPWFFGWNSSVDGGEPSSWTGTDFFFPTSLPEFTSRYRYTSSDVEFIDTTHSNFLFSVYYVGLYSTCPGCSSKTAKGEGLKNLFTSAIYRSSRGIFYVSTHGGGVYRSTNSGTSWELASKGIDEPYVWEILRLPSGYLYVATAAGVFLSTDGGQTWQPKNKGLESTFMIALGATAKGTLLACNVYSVYRSTDMGESWTKADKGLNSTSVNSFYTGDNGRIYAATIDWGVQYSTDEGQSWKASQNNYNEPKGQGRVFSIVQHEKKKRLYAATQGAVIVTKDSAKSWEEMNEGVVIADAKRSTDGHIMFDIDVDNEKGYVYAAAVDGVYRQDALVSDAWSKYGEGLNDTTLKTITVNQSGDVFAGLLTNGVSRSTDYGMSWRDYSSGLDNKYIYSMMLDDSSYLYVGTYGDGIYRTNKPTATLAAPQLQYPANDTLQKALSVSLQWKKVPYAKVYHLIVSREDGGIVVNDSTLQTPIRKINSLQANTKYLWKVRSISAKVYSPWSEEWHFNTASTLPDKPELQYPPKDTTLSISTTPLLWKSAVRADSYTLHLANDSSFATLLLNTQGISILNVASPTLAPNQHYYWRVRGVNSNGEGEWSDVWKFNTGNITSVEDETSTSVYLFPQPAGETLHIMGIEEREVEVVIADMQGRILLSTEAAHINISGLADGVYTCRINAGGKVHCLCFSVVR